MTASNRPTSGGQFNPGPIHKTGINSLDEALRTFSLKTQSEQKLTADKVGQAWDQIKNSTSVSLSALRRAFDQYAAAATAANGGIEPSAVKV